MAEATYAVLYEEDGWLEPEHRPGALFPAVRLERWSGPCSCVRYIVTAGYKLPSDTGPYWVDDPATTLLDLTENAAAIRYAIRAYDALKADLYAKPKA